MGADAGSLTDAAVKSLSAIAKIPAESQSMQVEDLRFSQAGIIARAFNVQFMSERLEEFEEIAASEASVRDPAASFFLRTLLGNVYTTHPSWTGDLTKMRENMKSMLATTQAAASNDPDMEQRAKCYILQFALPLFFEFSSLLSNPSFDWTNCFGPDGSHLMKVLRSYDPSIHSTLLADMTNGDWMHAGTAFWPILLHWGDLENSRELEMRAQGHLKRLLVTPWKDEDYAHIIFFPGCHAHLYFATELQDGRETLVGLMDEARMTWRAADATVDMCKTQWIRKRGDKTKDLFWGSVEFLAWSSKLGYVLIAPGHALTAEEVLVALPSVDEIIDMTMASTNMSMQHGVQGLYNLFHNAAAVCEKYEAYDRALEYIDAALSRDLRKAGTLLPISRMYSQILRGRILAALNRPADAGSALETAAAEARQYSVRLYEAFALRDLKLCVHDPMGHGDHASRRLGAALRLLKGPADKLTPLLHGLDATELMALPPPDASYLVVYEADPAENALRRELEGLKLKELRQRAKVAGMSVDELESAMDAEEPEESLVVFLIEQHTADLELEAGAASLRSELQGLGLKALRKRAKDVGCSA
jgi:tetratricopeptide (TPR) repeat protein